MTEAVVYTEATWPTSRWVNFTFQEMCCKHCGILVLDTSMMDNLQFVRKEAGFPLIISSGYRCQDHPSEIDKPLGGGSHTFGQAVDIRIHTTRAHVLLKLLLIVGFTGIGVSQKNKDMDRRFIHADTMTEDEHFLRNTIWSY